jgi:osmotically inducible lipoprotein OsmB
MLGLDSKGIYTVSHSIKIIPLLCVMALALSSCGYSPGSRALSGAAIGAGAGAIIGAVTGVGPGVGAAVGGGVGAVAGAATNPHDLNLGRPLVGS